MMHSARKLILVDESDREYKHLQRPTNAVAKTKHSLEVSKAIAPLQTIKKSENTWPLSIDT